MYASAGFLRQPKQLIFTRVAMVMMKKQKVGRPRGGPRRQKVAGCSHQISSRGPLFLYTQVLGRTYIIMRHLAVRSFIIMVVPAVSINAIQAAVQLVVHSLAEPILKHRGVFRGVFAGGVAAGRTRRARSIAAYQ